MYPMCVAQSATRGTVEIRMTIGCAQLKHSFDFLSVLHCHVRAHSSWLRNRISVVRIYLKIDCPAEVKLQRPSQFCVLFFNKISFFRIDHMHMTSQKGAHVRWGSNEALPRASSPSMQPGGQPLHATPPGAGPPGPAH